MTLAGRRPPSQPPSRGETLRAILEARGIGQSEFARRVNAAGYGPCSFFNVHRWVQDRQFTEKNQERAALTLELPRNYFADPSGLERHERRVHTALAKFLATSSVASTLSPVDVETLRSIRFPDPERPPTVAFYEAVALAIRGHLRPNEASAVAEVNSAIDRTLATKRPLRRR